MKFAHVKRAFNITFIICFVLTFISGYVFKTKFDLKTNPDMLYYYTCFTVPLFFSFLGTILVPTTGLSRLSISKKHFKYLAFFSLASALFFTLCIIVWLSGGTKGILAAVGFQVFTRRPSLLIAVGFLWSLFVNIFLGR